MLGGLGAKRLEMVRIGLPVPPGFTVTTEACTAYLNAGGQVPDRLWAQVLDALQALEKKMDVANT